MKTYVLTPSEAEDFDWDEESCELVMDDLEARFGPLTQAGERVDTEVRHPEGFVVSTHTYRPEKAPE